MIRAMIFDLDGTLMQTEKLKAISYARAAMSLCPQDISEEAVEAFKENEATQLLATAQRKLAEVELQSA